LQHGRLVDSGSHDELLESSMVYREIHASQLAEPDELVVETEHRNGFLVDLQKELVS
jgi:hypothetical protein